MSVGQHIHIVDGKQVAYPNNACPICRPETVQPAETQPIPNVHRKGDTIVYQATKLQMTTTTWYAKEKCFLHSLRKASRDTAGKLIIGADNRLIWNQITIRINIPLMKQYMAEMQKIISELETQQTVQQTSVPQRA